MMEPRQINAWLAFELGEKGNMQTTTENWQVEEFQELKEARYTSI